MAPRHQIANVKCAPGELSFEARIGGETQAVWLRTQTPVLPTADAALAACLMPAMCKGGELTLTDPVSPRVLRTQREFQAIQRTWSRGWGLGEPLREVQVTAPTRAVDPGAPPTGRVAAFFSGGVDSWSTVLDNPDVTDLVFVRGFDLFAAHQESLTDEVESRLREAAENLGLPLHVVETNLRELSDPLLRWDFYYGCGVVTAAHFLAPLFDRVLIASDSDHEVQVEYGTNRLVSQLWSSERLEIVDDGGRYSRTERLRRIATHPVVQRTLRVCWENPEGAYNCGRCRKCLLTLVPLEAMGLRKGISTFPAELDLEAIAAIDLDRSIYLSFWEDVLDSVREAVRPELERPLERVIAAKRSSLGLPTSYRRRNRRGPPPTVRLAVVVPVWRQARYLAAAVQSALDQEVSGVGVVIVNDGCPEAETDRIAQALRDAHPERIAYLAQPNRGLSAARNAGIRRALARWPWVEAVFPLDADNLLSPPTLARLQAVLEEHPDAAWASPALEFFGSAEGQWQVPGSYLPYRQLFTNQCDAGSLIRRSVFDDGFEFDESMRDGFEDWELFLRLTLAGLHGVLAGPCGFRYRRRPNSMLSETQGRLESLEAEIRNRHSGAYTSAALTRREHTEAPRFALVRCDRGDVLLTADCDLEPRRLSIPDFARSLAAAVGGQPGEAGHVPAVTVLTSAAALEWLQKSEPLAETLFRIQAALRSWPNAALQAAGAKAPVALAVRASALAALRDGLPGAVETTTLTIEGTGQPPTLPALGPAAELIGIAMLAKATPRHPDSRPASHPAFFEHRHLDLGLTTFPSSNGARTKGGATA